MKMENVLLVKKYLRLVQFEYQYCFHGILCSQIMKQCSDKTKIAGTLLPVITHEKPVI